MRKLSYRNKVHLKQTAKAVGVLLLVLLLLGGLYLIYMQRFVVYHRDGVTFDFSKTTAEIPLADADGSDTPALQEVEIHYIDDAATGTAQRITGYYVTGQMLRSDLEGVQAALEALQEPCSVMLDLRGTSGKFYYSTKISGAETADLDNAAVDTLISDLKGRGFSLIARIPAFADTAFALAHMDCALQLSSGALWADSDSVYWLDPASATVQGYLQQVCKELSSLGFTEVVFDDFYFPTSGNIAYESSQTKAEIIQDAATALRNAFAASNLHISFCVQDAAAALTGVTGRLYFAGIRGEDLETIAAAAAGSVTEPAAQLVFLTTSRDTRFDSYSVLRPLLEEETPPDATSLPPESGDTSSDGASGDAASPDGATTEPDATGGTE